MTNPFILGPSNMLEIVENIFTIYNNLYNFLLHGAFLDLFTYV